MGEVGDGKAGLGGERVLTLSSASNSSPLNLCYTLLLAKVRVNLVGHAEDDRRAARDWEDQSRVNLRTADHTRRSTQVSVISQFAGYTTPCQPANRLTMIDV